MRVSFHPEAFHEVEEAQAWYEERSMLAAGGFLHELSVALRRLAQSPHRYPVALFGTRRVFLERFPFTVFFRAGDDEVLVVAVAHRSVGPGPGRIGDSQPNRRCCRRAVVARAGVRGRSGEPCIQPRRPPAAHRAPCHVMGGGARWATISGP